MNGNGGSSFLRSAATLTGIVVGVLTLFLAVLLPLYGSPPGGVQSNVQQAQDTANAALTRALHNTIKAEKICSNTNEAACVDLFDRLSRNITRAQRKQLACDVLGALNRQAVAKLRAASGCPTLFR